MERLGPRVKGTNSMHPLYSLFLCPTLSSAARPLQRFGQPHHMYTTALYAIDVHGRWARCPCQLGSARELRLVGGLVPTHPPRTSLTRINSSSLSSDLFTSGCNAFACLLNAVLMSSADAVVSTPRTS